MVHINHIELVNPDSLSDAKVVVKYNDDSGAKQEMSAKLSNVHPEAMDKVRVGAEFESVFELALFLETGEHEDKMTDPKPLRFI